MVRHRHRPVGGTRGLCQDYVVRAAKARRSPTRWRGYGPGPSATAHLPALSRHSAVRMRARFLGTAAAEGYPDAFCGGDNCRRARDAGGPSLRKRSSLLIDDELLLDLDPDVLTASPLHAAPLDRLRYCLQIHEPADHLHPAPPSPSPARPSPARPAAPRPARDRGRSSRRCRDGPGRYTAAHPSGGRRNASACSRLLTPCVPGAYPAEPPLTRSCYALRRSA